MWWHVGGWVVAVAGGAVVLWALFWDRSRGRLRCRKCWYRLEGVAAEDAGGVRCPECGRVHGRRGSMRRTRRRWRVVLAVVLLVWVPFYAARVTPDVRARGWLAAAPGWSLAGASAFLSDEPGTGPGFWIMAPPSPPTLAQRIGEELGHYQRRLGWLSRRAVFLCGRLVSDEALTDETCARGSGLKRAINQLVRTERAYGFESRWARSVLHCEVRTRERWAPGAAVYGELRCRRLLSEGYTLDVGGNVAWFDAWAGHGFGGWYNRNAEEWRTQEIERARWDGLQRRERAGPVGVHDTVIRLGRVDRAAVGPTSVRLHVRLYERPNASQSEWRPVLAGVFTREVEFVADASAGPLVLGAGETPGNVIEAYLDAKLVPTFDHVTGTWKPAVLVWPEGPRVGPVDEVTFGGRVSVAIEEQGDTGPRYRDLLVGDETWWAWGATPEARAEDPDARPMGDPALWAQGYRPGPVRAFRHRGSEGAVPVRTTRSWVGRELGQGDRLVVRIEPEDFSGIVYADLDAQRVYPHPIVISLRGWTLEEINRLRVSGVWPDHAMP